MQVCHISVQYVPWPILIVLSKGKFRLSKKLSRSWQVSFSSGPDRLCISLRKNSQRMISKYVSHKHNSYKMYLFSSKTYAGLWKHSPILYFHKLIIIQGSFVLVFYVNFGTYFLELVIKLFTFPLDKFMEVFQLSKSMNDADSRDCFTWFGLVFLQTVVEM